MRFITVLPAACLLVSKTAFADEEEDDDQYWSQFETVEEPMEEEDEFEGIEVDEQEQVTADTSMAELVDADMDESLRQIRMAVCVNVVRQKYSQDQDEITKSIEQMAKVQSMTEDEVLNALHMSWIKNCYLNLNQEADLPKLAEPTEFDETANRLVNAPKAEGKKSFTLLERQWKLVKDFLEQEQASKTENGGNGKTNTGNNMFNKMKLEFLGSGMNGFQKFLYFVSVFGGIFGGGYLLVKKMMGLETEKKQQRRKKNKAN